MPRLVASALGVTLLIGSGVVAGGIGVTAVSASSTDSPTYSFCPRATPLLNSGTTFKQHQLGPGISLSEATLGTGRKRLRLSVVRVNLDRQRRVKVGSLHHTLTTRRRLSTLAARPHLVAATNGGYFDFSFGSPTVPLIGTSGPLVLSRRHATVAGISDIDRAQDGQIWLQAHVTSAHGRHRLGALNEVNPPPGLSVYTPAWGQTSVPLVAFGRSRAVHAGRVVGAIGRRRRVPRHGELLVATSRTARAWLRRLPASSAVALSLRTGTDAVHPFREAYGVGTRVVQSAHHIRTGLYCRSSAVYAARTDIAWRKHGRRLILATIASPRGGDRFGVDENQMSEVMVRLGAARSYALDGGGSTELVAKLPNQHRLSIRTPTPDGHERRIPVGIGVYSLPKPKHHRHHTHGHRKRKRKRKSKGGILGGILGGLRPPPK